MQQRTDIPALREALAKATPGEWTADPRDVSSSTDGANIICDRPEMPGSHARWPDNSAFIVAAHNALPALLDELEELRALTTPEVIGEEHRNGGPWQVWEPFYERWVHAKWIEKYEMWRRLDSIEVIGTPTHALPMPGEVPNG